MSAGARRFRLLFIWVVLAALVAGIFMLKSQDHAREAAEEAQVRQQVADRYLLSVPVASLAVIEVAHRGTLHRFERDPDGLWFYHGLHAVNQATHEHKADPAIAERIEKAFSALDRARMERTFPFDPKANDYGLTTPQTLLLIYQSSASEPLARFAFGDIAPDGHSQYVLRLGASEVFTMASYQLQNLLDLIQSLDAEAAEQARAGSTPTGKQGASR